MVLFFGLLRPYKGVEVLLDAWRGIEDAELWIVGRPRMPIEPLRALAPASVRFVPRYVSDAELPAFFRRADVVVLPYSRTERFDQSGVLATALAFGKPTVVSDVGGFGEVAAAGAARLVAPDDPDALRAALAGLLADPQEREGLACGALTAGVGAVLVAGGGRPDPRPVPRVGWIAAGDHRRDRVLAVDRPGGVRARRLSDPARAAGGGARPRDRARFGVRARPRTTSCPLVSVIVAAYAEQDVIAERVANIRALDYPPQLIELIVACDGSVDETAARARAAGADVVLELPRGGKIRAQDAAVERAAGEIVAFSDANVTWEPDALRRLVAPFSDARVGYVCGEVQLVDAATGSNQEGLYWRYELALRALESRVRSVTGGNGAIYATRRESYLVVDPIMGHDLSFPFNMVKRGWLAVAVREAQASEKMVPTLEGEFARKRRMMSHTWPIVLRGGMLSPRGYDPLYAFMIVSHRILRYVTPFLHVIALVAEHAAARAGLGVLGHARAPAGRARGRGARGCRAGAPVC